MKERRHVNLQIMANAVRALSMDAVEQAKSGHPGMPMGMADAATVLFAKHMKFDASAPNWADRDRFVLSAGHGSMLLYALLHLTGYADVTLNEIKAFRQLGSKTPGHPEYGHTSGVETTTGPLGQGLGNAVGLAMGERSLQARFGRDLVDHRTWVIAGDGCLMEGISQEAIAIAGRHKLEKLVVLWDDNDICIDGAVTLTETTDQLKRFEAAGWATLSCDGHDLDAVDRALDQAKLMDRPVLIAVKTTIGFGAPNKAGTKSAHGEPLGADELAAAKAALGWAHGAFEVPDDVRASWLEVGRRGAEAHAGWSERLAASSRRTDFEAALGGTLPAEAREALRAHANAMAETKPSIATRAASGAALNAVFGAWENLMGGSADLTGSVNTLVKGTTPFLPEEPSGRYVHWGVREHGMAAAMNGLALHGGIVPYAGTFLVFSDYSRPAIRLAALMGLRVIHVLTHDSIGLGEDGPTHQAVEHLAALRAIPNLAVFRPCDAVEAAECWELALDRIGGPSALVLSRQAVPAVRSDAGDNRSAFGAYELVGASGPAQASLFATGSEISIALAARERLEAEGVATRIVSVPCVEYFMDQDDDYRRQVVGDAPANVVIEAAIAQGWSDVVPGAAFVGMHGFGASAPGKALFTHFGIDADAVVAAVRARL
jgi:transketolase